MPKYKTVLELLSNPDDRSSSANVRCRLSLATREELVELLREWRTRWRPYIPFELSDEINAVLKREPK